MAGSLSFNSTRNADIYLHTALVESFQESSASGRKLHVTAFHSYLEKATFNKTHTSPKKSRAEFAWFLIFNTILRPAQVFALAVKVAMFAMSKLAVSYVHL